MAHVRFGSGGWLRWTADDGTVAYLRFDKAEDEQQQLKLMELYLAPEEGVTPDTLRSLRLSWIEKWMNGRDNRKTVLERLELPGPDLRTAAMYYATSFGPKVNHWVAQMLRAQVRGSEVGGPPKEGPGRHQRRRAARLEVPDKSPYPNRFYQDFAETYAAIAGLSDRPAAEIAEANHVPLTTVHRWAKESRRRGYLKGRRARD